MENPLRPSPLVGEILPGFTTIVILGIAYCHAHPDAWSKFAIGPTTGAVLGCVFVILLTSWLLGAIADSVRDILEEYVLDKHWPMNWDFLFHAPPDSIEKLDSSWLAYYFLNGNLAISLIAVVIAGCCISAVHIPVGWDVAFVLAAAILAVGAWITRKEVRRLIGHATIASPHDQVYTRLGVSKRKPSPAYGGDPPGVGVIAIQHIPQGTLVFSPDDDETAIALRHDVERLPTTIKKLYTDFCVERDGMFTCPVSFNKLTPAWYVNDCAEDSDPNVKPDESLRFFAIRDIQAGEELLARYKDYSD